MSDPEDTAFDHLVGIMGLAGLPRESWSDHDAQVLNDARKFVQLKRRATSEGKFEEASGISARGARSPEGCQEAESGVREEGVPLEEGAEDPSAAEAEE